MAQPRPEFCPVLLILDLGALKDSLASKTRPLENPPAYKKWHQRKEAESRGHPTPALPMVGLEELIHSPFYLSQLRLDFSCVQPRVLLNKVSLNKQCQLKYISQMFLYVDETSASVLS